MIIDILYVATSIYVIFCMAWRIVCFFRKKGSCKFRGCPFRKNYTSRSCIYFRGGGSTKCPTTPDELAIYRRTPEGIVKNLLNKQEKL